jgi:hypothetical protein
LNVLRLEVYKPNGHLHQGTGPVIKLLQPSEIYTTSIWTVLVQPQASRSTLLQATIMAALADHVDLQSIVIVTTLLLALYSCYLTVERLYFSPISGFPGPRLAAATFWYEFYYDFWQHGKYIFEIEEMHKKYGWHNADKSNTRQSNRMTGPIVRINPEELSISDPDFYSELYVTESKRRTNNYDLFCKGIDFEGTPRT